MASQFSSINTMQVSPLGPKSLSAGGQIRLTSALIGKDSVLSLHIAVVSQNVDDDDLIHSFGLVSCLKVQSILLGTKVGVGFD